MTTYIYKEKILQRFELSSTADMQYAIHKTTSLVLIEVNLSSNAKVSVKPFTKNLSNSAPHQNNICENKSNLIVLLQEL